MTQVGEAVGLGEVNVDEVKCPFDHTTPEPPDVKNDFIGVGGTLARKMKNGEGTHLYPPMKGPDPAPIKNPKDDPNHYFHKKAKVVKIVATAGAVEHVHLYPVSCAAHHCIPAQESLKVSPLLAYMVDKDDPEPLKDDSFKKGLVWSDVGYDINGSENGIFLPGSYAVGGGRGGMGVWASTEDGDEDAPEEAEDSVADPESNELTGALNDISASNRKWQYVKQAVKLCPGQFHDRHVDYSKFVQGILKKMFENYQSLHTKMIDEAECPDCKKRLEKIAKDGVPTPYTMVQRLNDASNRLAGFLTTKSWRINIYTSQWGKAYMEAVKSGRPDAE
jgi:hypothetical protein